MNNPWIKDVSTAGVQGLDTIEGCSWACWCESACDTQCGIDCQTGDAFQEYYDDSGRLYQHSYDGVVWLC